MVAWFGSGIELFVFLRIFLLTLFFINAEFAHKFLDEDSLEAKK